MQRLLELMTLMTCDFVTLVPDRDTELWIRTAIAADGKTQGMSNLDWLTLWLDGRLKAGHRSRYD